jgi:hypothetical protein
MNKKILIFIVPVTLIALVIVTFLYLASIQMPAPVQKTQNNNLPVNQPPVQPQTQSNCADPSFTTPTIISLSATSGPVGTPVEIYGCNFQGFEGDLNAWIINDHGIKGILYGEDGSTDTDLKVTLKSPLCQGDNSYSGFPCDAWLTLTPGNYKIYTEPWAEKSNGVDFTIQ